MSFTLHDAVILVVGDPEISYRQAVAVLVLKSPWCQFDRLFCGGLSDLRAVIGCVGDADHELWFTKTVSPCLFITQR